MKKMLIAIILGLISSTGLKAAEINVLKAADVRAMTKLIPAEVPVLRQLTDDTKQRITEITVFCSKRDVSLWGKVTGKGAALGFKIWDPDNKNGGYLARVPSQTKQLKYEGGDQSGQLSLTLYIPPDAFKLGKNEKFTSTLYVLGDGNDTADKYNLDCVIK